MISISQIASGIKKSSPLHGALLLFILLLSADFAFVLIHSISKLISPTNEYTLLSLETDKGYPEMFQYVKWFWLTLLFISLSIKRKALSYFVWALFFKLLLLDDSLRLHERAASSIARLIDITPPFGLRPHEIGELIFAGTVGFFFLSLILLALKRGSRAFRRVSFDTLLLVAALAFFGVFVDMVYISLAHVGGAVTGLLGIIEDGGEMLVASAMLGYVFAIVIAHDENAAPYLLGILRSLFGKRNGSRRMR